MPDVRNRSWAGFSQSLNRTDIVRCPSMCSVASACAGGAVRVGGTESRYFKRSRCARCGARVATMSQRRIGPFFETAVFDANDVTTAGAHRRRHVHAWPDVGCRRWARDRFGDPDESAVTCLLPGSRDHLARSGRPVPTDLFEGPSRSEARAAEVVSALFTAAQVDQLGDAQRTDGSGRGVPAIDAWVAVFQDRVRQIEAPRCQPAR